MISFDSQLSNGGVVSCRWCHQARRNVVRMGLHGYLSSVSAQVVASKVQGYVSGWC